MADANNLNKVGEWNPTYISGMIKRFIHAGDCESALELAERSLKEAKEMGDPLWINKFEEQHKEINQMTPSKIDVEDLTQIDGIGRVMEGKLKLAGFKSITQIANSSPQELSEAEGLGLKGANKIILSAKELLRNESTVIEDKKDKNIGNKYNGGAMFDKKYDIDRRTKSIPPMKGIIEVPELPEANAELESILEITPLEKKDIEMAPEYESYVVEPFMEDGEQKEKEIEGYSKSLDTDEEDDNISFDLDDDSEEEFVNGYEEEQYQLRPELKLRIEELVKHFTDDKGEEESKKTKIFKKQVEHDFNDSFPKEISEPHYEESEEETFVINDDYSLEDELLNEKQVAKLGSEAINVFKSRGYSILPKKTKNIDFLALNIIKVEDSLRVINIFPVKISNLKGSLIISEKECGYSPFSEGFKAERMVANELFNNIEKVMKESQIQAFENFTLENSLFLYIKKKFDHKLKIEKTKGKKNILIRAGPIRYKLIIDPLLICKKEVQFEEKIILFPYQRESNIHYAELKALNNLLEFLEKKYYLIEDNSEDKNSVKNYFEMKNKLITDTGKYSIPFIAIPSLLLLLMVLIPSLSSLSFNLSIAVIVIYGITLGYLYLSFSKKKGELIKLFNTPYHQRPVGLDETDLEIIRGVLSLKLLDQLIYECFGKKADFEIIASLEEEKSAIRFDYPEIKDKKDSEKDTIISDYGRLLEDLD